MARDVSGFFGAQNFHEIQNFQKNPLTVKIQNNLKKIRKNAKNWRKIPGN